MPAAPPCEGHGVGRHASHLGRTEVPRPRRRGGGGEYWIGRWHPERRSMYAVDKMAINQFFLFTCLQTTLLARLGGKRRKRRRLKNLPSSMPPGCSTFKRKGTTLMVPTGGTRAGVGRETSGCRRWMDAWAKESLKKMVFTGKEDI